MDGYDLIGDVHGCGATLVSLLERLGYRQRDGVYCHPRRQVIFLGDLIDRGPRVRLAVTIAKRMVEAGEAFIVMGNHEFNALTYSRREQGGSHRWLRAHTPRHNRVIKETLEQYRQHPGEWLEVLDWFMRLPLFLEFDDFRVVHACWDQALIERLRRDYPDGRIDDDFLERSVNPHSDAFAIIDRLTRGSQLRLPPDVEVRSSDGIIRRSFRTHFWAHRPLTYGDVIFQPDNLPGDLEWRELSDKERAQLSYYGPTEPPLFIGHYWCAGIPALPAPNIACLDYSAVKHGHLVAYRWSGETRLNADHFEWVSVPKAERARPQPWEIELD
ncbi:metallophosphoesterase [Aidingimonas lacisalsi]|uniref:metallophosphoesterase n=1 Tax=Aidingimonas lacisalsi TaxID=2604086 RepID=UPI0011D261B1|nr:metallophosphoesterase [Aidingimonas lacisalsi]